MADDNDTWRTWQTQGGEILNRGLEVWKPVIAAVNGYCLAGGMTLLFATDIRVAVEHARFGISEVKRGILPGNGKRSYVLRRILRRAAYLGRTIGLTQPFLAETGCLRYVV